MAEPSRQVGLGVVALVVLMFATPSLLFVALVVTDVSPPAELVVAIVLVPLLAVGAGLAYIAREVASSPDEPELLDGRLAERVGMTNEEYEELFER